MSNTLQAALDGNNELKTIIVLLERMLEESEERTKSLDQMLAESTVKAEEEATMRKYLMAFFENERAKALFKAYCKANPGPKKPKKEKIYAIWSGKPPKNKLTGKDDTRKRMRLLTTSERVMDFHTKNVSSSECRKFSSHKHAMKFLHIEDLGEAKLYYNQYGTDTIGMDIDDLEDFDYVTNEDLFSIVNAKTSAIDDGDAYINTNDGIDPVGDVSPSQMPAGHDSNDKVYAEDNYNDPNKLKQVSIRENKALSNMDNVRVTDEEKEEEETLFCVIPQLGWYVMHQCTTDSTQMHTIGPDKKMLIHYGAFGKLTLHQ